MINRFNYYNIDDFYWLPDTQLLTMLGRLGQLSVTVRVQKYKSVYFSNDRIKLSVSCISR